MVALTGLFYPWAFYLGGKFHILPYWQGWGTLHAKSGDYGLWVQFEPTPHGSKMYLSTNLTGTAQVCTPRGENIHLHLGGGMRKHLNLSTDGEPVYLYVYYWPWNANFIADHNPSLDLRGNWHNPNLVMDDQGSIAKAFQPDVTVRHGSKSRHDYTPEVVPITLSRGSYGEFEKACASLRK